MRSTSRRYSRGSPPAVKAQGFPIQCLIQWIARVARPEEGSQFFQQLRAAGLVVDQFASVACLVPLCVAVTAAVVAGFGDVPVDDEFVIGG
jgi:hypothetical protein